MKTDVPETGDESSAQARRMARGRRFSRAWNHDDEETRSGVIAASPLPAVAPTATAQPISNYARLDRVARMIGALRLIESDLRTLNAGPGDENAHALRICRAHALALIDRLGDVASQAG